MQVRLLAFALAAAFANSAPLPAQFQTVDLAPVRDNTLYSEPNGALSNGSGTGLFCGRTGQGRAVRTVLAFDVAARVPAGSVITRADLILNLSRTRSAAMTIGAHRLSRAWGEGASQAFSGGGGGAAAQTGDATWLHTFFPNQRWATAGGDFVATASASTVVGSTNGPYTWASTAALVADVQAMLDQPATDFGWLLRGNESLSAKRFDSRESTISLRPKLRLTYGPRAEITPFGNGCNSSLATPLVLAASALPQLGTTWNALLTGAPDGSASLLFFAIGLQQVPIPIGNGCEILLDLASTQLFASTGISPYGPAIVTAGVATQPVFLPNHGLLAGLRIDYQAFLLDPAPVTVRSSNVLRARIGL